MKSFKSYIKGLSVDSTFEPTIVMENDTMRPLKKYTQVDINGEEGLYETNVDRWSRNAKHQLTKADLANVTDVAQFEEGDMVVYEGKEVQVKIPQGPKGTTGIMFEGHLKMVQSDKLSILDEAVMGGVQTMSPINRIMQLAGLEHSGAVSSDVVETVVNEEVINETDAAGMMTQLVTSAMNQPQYKNNEEAARLFVIGSLLSQIYKDVTNNKLQTVVGQSKMTELNPLGAMGADLIKTSQTLAQGQSTGTTPAQTKG
jgi:hypothetical protein